MSTGHDRFLRQLRETFKVEAAEHVQAMVTGLLALEKAPASAAQLEIVETVFRAAHSLKGAARTVNAVAIESLCRSLEDVFASWKRQEIAPEPEALDALHRTLDAITSALDVVAHAPATNAGPDAAALPPILRQAEIFTPSPLARKSDDTAPAAAKVSAEETVRVGVAKLETRLLESEEMLIAKITAGQRAVDLRELAGRFEMWRHEWAAVEPAAHALRLNLRSPDPGERPSSELSRVLDFFDWSLDTFKSIENRAVALGKAAERDRHAIGKVVDELLENSKQLLLLPFASLAAPLPKLVRDLCRDQGKDAELTIQGEDIEIDKRILEEMKDPLVHLLRNSVDHGIESPAERTRLGKSVRGAITIEVTQVNGSKVQLLLSDDGAGLDTGKLKDWAIRRQQISTQDAGRLGEAEAHALIFQSGVSTSPMITQLSGRGLGLAIVREKAEKLGGTVTVESRPGVGTAFRILLPATRATFRGILVEAAGRVLVVPTAQVERIARARPENVQTVEGRETLALEGRAVSLVQLAEVLELPSVEHRDAPAAGVPVIILGRGEQRVAFAVDAVLDEQEVLVKPLRKPLVRVRNVAAATVLGSGQVAPILNVADLLKSATRSGAARPRSAPGAKPAEASTVLVAEDSITSRMMIKNILEAAGYAVKTAVDGMEAYTLLRAEKFDLVVSDVEMPRLNGFDLTARIRADRALAALPVVLVTALETREDRERGIDAGANAYLAKSDFDQSALLEAVRRLVWTGVSLS
jgi:two-component system chemotaxis sensor kinase CheA